MEATVDITHELMAGFLDEAAEHLDELNDHLMAFETDAERGAIDFQRDEDRERMTVMFRAAHSLKGLSATFGFADINHLTHTMETLFDQAPGVPSGYRSTEEGGLELRPGYLEGQRDLAAAKRDPSGGGRTALQKDVPYIAKLLGINKKEALALKMESKGKGYDAYLRDIAARYVSFGENPQRAYGKAKAVADLVYGRAQPPEANPDSKGLVVSSISWP